jgi:dipeptidyl aminopeptidase/acylaminoacyl peptidase
MSWPAALALLVANVAMAAELGLTSPPVVVEPAAPVKTAEPGAVDQDLGELEFVRILSPAEAGLNDSNPVWSSTGNLIAFERSRGDKREIVVARLDGKQVQKIYFQLSEEVNEEPAEGKEANKETKVQALFIPGFSEDPSFNSGVSWGRDSRRLAFMSNGGEGNYDIYSQELGGNAQRLTDHKEKDGLAQWSPVSDQLVFVSGRTGKGDAYLLDAKTRALTQLTRGDKPYLYPRWSPDGKKLALFYGSSENHDVYVMDNLAKPVESLRALTSWNFDDLRPAWSPDGKKIAFYTNYNLAGDPSVWSLAVVAADGSDGTSSEALAKRIVATDVLPDVEQGPAWLAGSDGLIYVKDEKLEYNPIYMVELSSGKSVQLKTGTKMNHDISCTADGLLAFRAQVDQWDQIFVAKLKNKK